MYVFMYARTSVYSTLSFCRFCCQTPNEVGVRLVGTNFKQLPGSFTTRLDEDAANVKSLVTGFLHCKSDTSAPKDLANCTMRWVQSLPLYTDGMEKHITKNPLDLCVSEE